MALVAVVASASSCGSKSRPEPAVLNTAGLDAGEPSAGRLLGDSSFGGGVACPMETQFVYVVTTEDDLYRFDPPSLQFALVGHLSCSHCP